MSSVVFTSEGTYAVISFCCSLESNIHSEVSHSTSKNHMKCSLAYGFFFYIMRLIIMLIIIFTFYTHLADVFIQMDLHKRNATFINEAYRVFMFSLLLSKIERHKSSWVRADVLIFFFFTTSHQFTAKKR